MDFWRSWNVAARHFGIAIRIGLVFIASGGRPYRFSAAGSIADKIGKRLHSFEQVCLAIFCLSRRTVLGRPTVPGHGLISSALSAGSDGSSATKSPVLQHGNFVARRTASQLGIGVQTASNPFELPAQGSLFAGCGPGPNGGTACFYLQRTAFVRGLRRMNNAGSMEKALAEVLFGQNTHCPIGIYVISCFP
jgi:hypothetical protein